MPDKLSIEQRHYNMSRIRGKDTKPEMIVRKYLWSRGFRYRLNHNRLPGKPDVVLRKYRTCIFVNGCFWHGHNLPWDDFVSDEISNMPLDSLQDSETINHSLDSLQNSECCKIPHTRRDFWVAKILRNKRRDIDVQKKLADMGWHCLTVWECELKSTTRDAMLERLAYTLNHIYLQDHTVFKYEIPDEEMSIAAEDDM